MSYLQSICSGIRPSILTQGGRTWTLWVWRSFWLIMLLMHTPALVSTCRNLGTSGLTAEASLTVLAIVVTMLYFLLKLIGARFLQFQMNRKTIIALCLITALLHVGVIGGESDPMWTGEYSTLLISTTVLLGSFTIVRRMLRGGRMRDASRARHLPELHPFDHIAWLDVFRPHCWKRALHLFTSRAPPV